MRNSQCVHFVCTLFRFRIRSNQADIPSDLQKHPEIAQNSACTHSAPEMHTLRGKRRPFPHRLRQTFFAGYFDGVYVTVPRVTMTVCISCVRVHFLR